MDYYVGPQSFCDDGVAPSAGFMGVSVKQSNGVPY